MTWTQEKFLGSCMSEHSDKSTHEYMGTGSDAQTGVCQRMLERAINKGLITDA